jgi:hypothetical protein
MSGWGACYRRPVDGGTFEGEAIDVTFMPLEWDDNFSGHEVIAIQTEDTSDVLIYDHWLDGKLVRGLSYSMDRGFDRALGDPDAWEAQVFAAPITEGGTPYVSLQTLMTAIERQLHLPHVG